MQLHQDRYIMKYECEDCGHKWQIEESDFALFPYCPCCESDFILDEKDKELLNRD